MAESVETSKEASVQCETADEDICACTEVGGGGRVGKGGICVDRESKGADEASQKRSGSLPPS